MEVGLCSSDFFLSDVDFWRFISSEKVMFGMYLFLRVDAWFSIWTFRVSHLFWDARRQMAY